MKIHEFYSKYANVPLHKRMVPLDVIRFGSLNLNDIYMNIDKNHNEIRNLEEDNKTWMGIAENYILDNQA